MFRSKEQENLDLLKNSKKKEIRDIFLSIEKTVKSSMQNFWFSEQVKEFITGLLPAEKIMVPIVPIGSSNAEENDFSDSF